MRRLCSQPIIRALVETFGHLGGTYIDILAFGECNLATVVAKILIINHVTIKIKLPNRGYHTLERGKLQYLAENIRGGS